MKQLIVMGHRVRMTFEDSQLMSIGNGGYFALGQGGDLHSPIAHANRHPNPKQTHPDLDAFFMLKSFNLAAQYCASRYYHDHVSPLMGFACII